MAQQPPHSLPIAPSLPKTTWKAPAQGFQPPSIHFPVQPQSCVPQSCGTLGSRGGRRGARRTREPPRLLFLGKPGPASCNGFHGCPPKLRAATFPPLPRPPAPSRRLLCKSKFLLGCGLLSASGQFSLFLQVGREPLCAPGSPAKSFLRSDLVPSVLRVPALLALTTTAHWLHPRASVPCPAPRELELQPEPRPATSGLLALYPPTRRSSGRLCSDEDRLPRDPVRRPSCGLTPVSPAAGPADSHCAPELVCLDSTSPLSEPASPGRASALPILGLPGAEGETLKSAERPRAHGDGEDGVA